MPTNYYLQIKPQIHQILEASEAMMDMQFDPSQSTRTFVLSSVMTEISVVISGVLPKMIERAPKVRLDLSKHDNEIAAVSEGKADFAVITDVDLAPDLHRMKLYPLDRVLLVRKGHPLTQLKGPLLTRYLKFMTVYLFGQVGPHPGSALSKAYSNTKGLWNTRGFLRRVSILHGALLRRRI